ncbi:MAG: hypothetical protein ABIE68_00110 [bacterium]
MTSPEQMGVDPEKLERKITTPEEAREMTRQRRIDYGLSETSNLSPEDIEKIDASIKELLERSGKIDYDSLTPELQDQCYWAEMEASAGKDRELAKTVLEKFLEKVENLEK